MNITEMIQICREADDIEIAAAQMAANASAAVRKQLAAKWLAEEARRQNREAALIVERRSLKVRLYRSAREEKREAERRALQSQRVVGPVGHKARRRWLEETAEGQAHAQREAQFEEKMRTIRREQREQIAALTDRWVSQLRADWTEELLNTGFALPDGRVVLWGDATVDEHAARRDQFMDNAQGNLEGAARHEAAIRKLQESGAPTLRDAAFAEAS